MSVSLDRQRLFRTETNRLLDLRPVLFRRVLVEDDQDVIVSELEDLSGDTGAHAIALAQVAVHDNAHARQDITLGAARKQRYAHARSPFSTLAGTDVT